MKILIIGGSRFVGPYIIDLLLKHKHNVTVFNRGNINSKYSNKVKFIQGDRDKTPNLLKEKYDAVIDMCAYTGKQTAIALKNLRFDYFLNFGTVAAYKYSEIFPLTENSPIGIYPAWGEYNKGKVECEEVLKKSKVKYATIRPTYILGPKNYCDRENFIYSRIKKGIPLVIPGNGQALNQFVFVDEVAKIIVMLTEKQIQGAFNIAGDDVISLVGLVNKMGEIVGKKPIIKFNHDSDGASFKEEEFPFSNENLLMSNEKIKKLGVKLIPLVEGLQRDYESYYKKTL